MVIHIELKDQRYCEGCPLLYDGEYGTVCILYHMDMMKRYSEGGFIRRPECIKEQGE
jgi:hypothetical protein